MLTRILDLDARYTRALRIAENPGWLRTLAAFFAHSGDSWFWYLALGLVWLFGAGVWKLWAFYIGVSVLVTAVLVLTIKFTVRRRRPEGEWGGVYRKTDPHSFPSGHATRAALLAVLAFSLGPAWLGWVLLVWAPLVILARVIMGVHYLLDVLAGAVLGILVGVVIAQFIPPLSFPV